jgi:hypothetical protein
MCTIGFSGGICSGGLMQLVACGSEEDDDPDDNRV